MELRKEYADIVERELIGWTASHALESTMRAVALACQELADRPPKELSSSEKYHLWLSVYDGVFGSTRCTNGSEVIDKIVAAFLEKQREPATVTVEVRLYRTNSGQTNCVSQVDASLDANFPFGNPTYKWIGDAFEITREVA